MDLEAPPLPRVTAPVAPGAGLAGAERPQPQFGAKRSAHGGAGGRPPAKTVTLEWHVEEFSVTPRPELLGGKPVQILSDIVGKTKSGEFTAVLGPSGSGKTTFLECLSLRSAGFTGAIHINGKPVKGTYYELAGFVHQHELFFSHLTVREHLLFHAINRNGASKTLDECSAMVERELVEVDLVRSADTIIGGSGMYVTKGISGGERKRLAIATELLSQPSILILDEPTSGLDSVMGELICLVLRDLAERSNCIVLSTIHTPSTKMWSYFTHALVFAGQLGGVAYHGPVSGIDGHFMSLGMPRPADTNPAEFLLEQISAVKVEESSGRLVANDSYKGIVEAYRAKRNRDKAVRRLDFDSSHKMLDFVFRHQSSVWVQMKQNVVRNWINTMRDSAVLAVLFVAALVLGLIFGTLYFQKAANSWRNPMSMVFALMVTLMVITLGHVSLHLPQDWTVFSREYHAGANTLLPYFVARSLSDLPRLAVISLMAVLPYFMMGLSNDPAKVLRYLVTMVLLTLGSASVGYLGASFSSNPAVGIVLAVMMVTPMILFSGMLYERSQVPAALFWMQDASIMNQAFSAVMANMCSGTPADPAPPSCSFLMGFLEIDVASLDLYMWQLLLLTVAYRLLSYIVLAIRLRLHK